MWGGKEELEREIERERERIMVDGLIIKSVSVIDTLRGRKG